MSVSSTLWMAVHHRIECHCRPGQGGAMNDATPALAPLELPVESLLAFVRAASNAMSAYSADVLSDKDAGLTSTPS